jgi:hypothetical protein
MRKIGFICLLSLLFVVSVVAASPAEVMTPYTVTGFVHVATASNISGAATVMNNTAINNNLNAIILITSNWNPPSGRSVFNNHPVGVRENALGTWEIFNRDNAPMPDGAAFNVAVVQGDPRELQQLFTPTASDTFPFNHPDLNTQPDAMTILTPVGQFVMGMPSGMIGLFYRADTGTWNARTEDGSVPGADIAAFNILPFTADQGFVQYSSGMTNESNWTYLTHPELDNNPNALILVTHSFNPGGAAGNFAPIPLGVWYDVRVNKWAIFNQDLSAMQVGLAFNVMIVPPMAASPFPTPFPTPVAAPTFTPAPTFSGPIACAPTRLSAGGQARVLPGNTVRLRNDPSTFSAQIATVTPSTLMQVIGGQTCDTSRGILWVKVNTGSLTGWVAEAEAVSYYIMPTVEVPTVPAPTLPPSMISSVIASTNPSVTAPCPATLTFSANITASQAGTITYRWDFSDGVSGAVNTLAFAGAGTQTVTYMWTLGASSTVWAQLHILTPVNIISNQAAVTLTCGLPPAPLPQVTNVTVSVTPINSVVCPMDTFTFDGAITTNGPTTVTYHWQRSDMGSPEPDQTLVFASMGTQHVSNSWFLGAGGTSGYTLVVTSPNSMSGNVTFTRSSCP